MTVTIPVPVQFNGVVNVEVPRKMGDFDNAFCVDVSGCWEISD